MKISVLIPTTGEIATVREHAAIADRLRYDSVNCSHIAARDSFTTLAGLAHLAPSVTLATAVAMHNAIERDTRLDVDIKWPNDLLIDNRKVCGILSEIQAEVDLLKTMIIGVGVNVNHEHFPEGIAQRATSLRIASGRIQSRIEILVEFLEEFESLYMGFERKGPRLIIDHWMRLSSFANGRKIEVHDGVRKICGITRGLNPLGALRVEQKDGQIQEIYSGDVVQWE